MLTICAQSFMHAVSTPRIASSGRRVVAEHYHMRRLLGVLRAAHVLHVVDHPCSTHHPEHRQHTKAFAIRTILQSFHAVEIEEGLVPRDIQQNDELTVPLERLPPQNTHTHRKSWSS